MKKTQRKDAVRNIRRRIVSYLSVCLVIMLGLGGAFVTSYMSAGINAKATAYYKESGFKDYELLSSTGITEEDIAQIAETEGVTDVEGVIRTEAALSKGGASYPVQLISRTERISVPEVLEGRAPASKNECMIGEDFASVEGLGIGDSVKIVMTDKSLAGDGKDAKKRALFETEFKITGLMKHPDHMRRKADNVVVCPMAAYNMDFLGDSFSHVYVRTEEPEGVDIFSDKYFKETSGTKQRLEELAAALETDSLARTKEKAYAELDKEWQKALDELENGQSEIDKNESELNSELASARKDLEDAQNKLDGRLADAGKKIADGEKQIRAAEKKIKNGEKELEENKEIMRQADELLPEAEEYIRNMREEKEQELKDLKDKISFMKSIIAGLDKVPIDSEIYKEKVMELAGLIKDSEKVLQDGQDFFKRDDVMKAAEAVRDITGVDTTGTINKIRDFNLKALIILAEEIEENEVDYEKIVAAAEECIQTVEEGLAELDEYEQYIEDYKANHDDLVRQLEEKEKELAKAKEELAAAKKKLAAAKKQMAAEKSKYEAQIRDGWNMYYDQKADFEQRLEEAKALLAENREEAEAKFAELRADVEDLDCKWLVLDRRANAGYVDIKSTIGSVKTSSLLFGMLFLLITAVVCFSTLSIIIEEQKKMVGTVKAFGFHKGEILGKYLTFGVSASVIGCIAGILGAAGLSKVVLNSFNRTAMYQMGPAGSVLTPGITILDSLLMIAICAAASFIACTDILRSPASLLMKGGTSKNNSRRKRKDDPKKSSARRGGSLYSRLILRNMRDDKVRVAISIIIIAFSTMIMGTGMSMKLAFDGMPDKQISEVHHFDVRVDLGDEVSEKELGAIEKVMTKAGAEYTLASNSTQVFRLGDRLDAVTVLAGEPDELGDFFAVRDTGKGEKLELPADGVLTQKKMKESYGMGEGTTLSIFNKDLEECSADVKGVFNNYVGRIVITSNEGYKNIFGVEAPANCYFVKYNGADPEQLRNELTAVKGDISFTECTDFISKFKTVTMMYNLIVYVSTGIAILMSFMILSNLSNIFLNRKKTELTVMRINGFSIKQAKGYLTKETIVTTAAGVVLGVLMGAAIAPVMIRLMEQPDIQFVRPFHGMAWLIAAGLEVLFSVIINSFVFRKVKDLDFRDVQ